MIIQNNQFYESLREILQVYEFFCLRIILINISFKVFRNLFRNKIKSIHFIKSQLLTLFDNATQNLTGLKCIFLESFVRYFKIQLFHEFNCTENCFVNLCHFSHLISFNNLHSKNKQSIPLHESNCVISEMTILKGLIYQLSIPLFCIFHVIQVQKVDKSFVLSLLPFISEL